MARPLAPVLSWPLFARPQLERAGRFPLFQKNSGYVYRSDTIALHQHDYVGEVVIGRRCFALKPGDVTLTPARVDSRYDLPVDGYHLCIHFRPERSRVGHPDTAIPLPLHIRPGTGAESIRQRIWWITDLYRRAESTDARKRLLALAAASAGLQELLLSLAIAEPAPRAAHSSSRVDETVQRAVELIETRLQTVLAIPLIAAEVGLSQNYLARAFRRRYGMAMPRFILSRRIELARHLLMTSESSVKEIAGEVGLPDVQHFNKQFRRLTGVSPSRFRLEA